MKQSIYTITENTPLNALIYRMVLQGDTSAITKSGQFINIKLDGYFLRRPISVCNYDEETITIIYKVVGEGTKALSQYKIGEKLDILTGLGNGYDTSVSGDSPLLIGGGVGVPPLYHLCRELIAQKKNVQVILGFNTAAEVFYAEEFRQAGARVYIATADGSLGTKGFVTDVFSEIAPYTHVYTCGPEPMLKAVYKQTTTSGQYSFEERMGCGFGACMGCSCKTKYGNKRICKDGPVLVKEEIIW